MTWVTPTNRSTGDVITAAIWNQDVVANPQYLKGQAGVIDFESAIRIGAADSGRIKREAANILAARDAADSVYGIFRVGAPVGANDAVPLGTIISAMDESATDETTVAGAFEDSSDISVTINVGISAVVMAIAFVHITAGARVRLVIGASNGTQNDVSSAGYTQVMARATGQSGNVTVKLQKMSDGGTQTLADKKMLVWALPA